MSCYQLLLLLMLQLMFYETDTLSRGPAPRWIVERFCKGVSGIVKLPWNCDGYLYCAVTSVGVSGTWLECASGLKFDGSKEICVRSPVICIDTQSIAQACSKSRDLKFPHPDGCALYYDCSQTQVLPQFNLTKYENECTPRQLFDPDLGQCRYDQPILVDCSNKPTSQSDYRKTSAPTSQECSGKANGLYPKPGVSVFSPEYIECAGGSNVASRVCNKGLVFDPFRRQCFSDIKASLHTYCRTYPFAVFPDSQYCARYYNCSLTTGTYLPNPYQSECLYMNLYDVAQGKCVMYDELTVPCGTRFEPIDPCDYKVGQCIGRTFCIPCDAKCKGKPDGPHPYPTLPNTRFHLMCKGGRTQDVLRCIDGQIYWHQHKLCLPAGVVNQPLTTPPPVKPTTTSPPVDPPVDLPVDPPVNPRTEEPICRCLDEINSQTTSLKNLSSFVDAMQVGNPYDCDEPPRVRDSIMKVTYEFDVAVARYECSDGYSVCGGQLRSTCTRDNIWSKSSLGECYQSRWIKKNYVILTCTVVLNSALLFRGRSVEDMFTFTLMNNDSPETLLYVMVKPTTRKIEAGRTSSVVEGVTAPIPLTGETIWTIEFKSTEFVISVNGRYLVSVINSAPLSSISKFFISGDFQAEEVKYLLNGIAPHWKRMLDVNLALSKVTSASSEYELAVSGRAVDGYSHVLWEEESCWTARSADTKPWWMVDLGKEFYVSHVFLTSSDCQGSTPCEKSLQNFEVNVYKTDPSKDLKAVKKVCSIYGASFPSRTVKRIDCNSDIVGRFVKIVANGAVSGQMTICEVEVYGGVVIGTGWSPFSCPHPPIIDGASAQLSYTDAEAMTTYTCDGSDVMCTGNKIIHCFNETGWDAEPGSCIKTIHDAGIGGSVPDFPICRLNLGSSIELWATPTHNSGYLALIHDSDTMWKMTLTLENAAKPIALTYILSGIASKAIYPPKSVFTKGKESHIIISALTDHLLIEVDGEIFNKIPVDVVNVHRADFVGTSASFRSRKIRINPGFIVDVIREPIKDNLALNADVDSSSSFNNPESYGVDGNPSQSWPTGSCWNADIGDTNQWYQVDLGKQYFIRDIKLDLRNFSDQKSVNLALRKETSGSPNYDSHSSHDNAVNGDHNDIRTSGSCYASSASIDDPWWMVDLGKEYTISSVAIQPRGESEYDNQHSGLSVNIHDTNPTLNANAKSTTCAEKTGPWGSFDRVPCRKPVAGRFVMVKRMVGANTGVMTLCEVQVYGSVESKLHDFTVNVYEENPETLTERTAMKRLCIKHKGEFPKDEPTTLTCAEDVWGRYVRIEADVIRDQYDMMTVCEVEVYGDKAVKKEWSPTDCPAPPAHNNAFSSVVNTPNKAEARYECFEGFATCSGRNTMTCSSEDGWQGSPETCRPRTFSAYDPSGLEVVHFCPLRLEEAIELYIIPTAVNSVLTLSAGAGVVFQMKWTKVPQRELTIATDLTTGSEYPPVFVELQAFEIYKESKVVITVLSHALHVAIDGESFYMAVGTAYLIDTVSTEKATMGKLSILETGVSKTLHIPLLDNLALSGTASASSLASEAGRAVDGDFSMSLSSNSCWKMNNGDMDAWWTVELNSLYYVSNVKITTREACGGSCDRRVHDFKIEMFHKEPASQDTGELCLMYDGILPHTSTTMLTCTKKVLGRVLRISAPDRRNTDDLFTLCEVEIFGGLVAKAVDGPRNLALFRPAITNTMADNVALASRAVDGNKNLLHAGGSCWMAAAGETDPWWQVELDNYFYISHVEITSRTECAGTCKDAVGDFEIEVSPAPPVHGLQRHLCLRYDGVFPHSTTKTLKCANKELGRFVRISSHDRTDSKSLFVLCEVEVYGEEVTVKESGLKNLAVNRPASSSSRMVPPDRAIDGDKNMVWSGQSCWASQDQEAEPWWMVELDDYYLVSAVELTSRKDCGDKCDIQLRAFVIEMFYKRPGTLDNGDVCLRHESVFPHSTTKMLECTKKTLGRFVRLASAQLTICEVGVYGGTVRNTGWTPSDCPEPPTLPNACVDICYNADHAVANYTCDTNYSMCTGSNVLYCDSKIGGWEGTPGTCVQTTREVHHGHVAALQEFPICYPKLGEGIEMWVTPQKTGSTLELFGDSKAVGLMIIPDNAEEPLIVTRVDSKISIKKQQLFALKKESHVVVLFLTQAIILNVDGILVAKIPHIPDSARISYVRSSDGLKVRMVRPVDRYMKGIIRVQNDKNLALKKVVSAESSQGASIASNVVDGDQSQSADNDKCWHPVPGEKDQWIMIDLGKYYFIRELVIYNRELDFCVDCAERTQDFVIDVLQTEKGDVPMGTCAVYEGVMPLGAIEKISCKEDVWGRFVRISTMDIKGRKDLITLCEVEIYGDEVKRKPWTSSDCPTPTLHKDASVKLLYSPGIAKANYTCHQDYTMCTGSNVLECTSYDGWKGSLGSCLRTTRELSYGRQNNLSKFPICNLKLGEGIELWVFPEKSSWEVSLLTGETGDTVLSLVSSPGQTGEITTISTVISGTRGNEVTVEKELFTLELEAHIQIIFLSRILLILVDGKSLATFPHHLATPKSAFIKSTVDVHIRKVKPLLRYLSGVVRTPLDDNLALNKVTTVASQFLNYNHGNLVDGDLSQKEGARCWHSAVGEKNQWLMIDLEDYYFITELVLYGRTTTCEACADRTHDFAIDILPNGKIDWMTTRCAFYEGVMPLDAVEKIRCKENAWGRYVRISNTNAVDDQDLMSFCEIQVYGDAVVEYIECQKLPKLTNGQVTYTGVKVGDQASLTCDANFQPCGDKTGVCLTTEQWGQMATSCEQYRWESPIFDYESFSCVDAFDSLSKARYALYLERTLTGNTHWAFFHGMSNMGVATGTSPKAANETLDGCILICITVQFKEPLPCGSYKDFMINIELTPAADANRVTLNLYHKDDILLHWDIRFNAMGQTNKVAVNSKSSGAWNSDIQYFQTFPFNRAQKVALVIAYRGTAGIYELHVEKVLRFSFTERMSGAKPDAFEVKEDATLSLVEILHNQSPNNES